MFVVSKDLAWNEKFTVSLRKKKKEKIIEEKRKRLYESE